MRRDVSLTWWEALQSYEIIILKIPIRIPRRIKDFHSRRKYVNIQAITSWWFHWTRHFIHEHINSEPSSTDNSINLSNGSHFQFHQLVLLICVMCHALTAVCVYLPFFRSKLSCYPLRGCIFRVCFVEKATIYIYSQWASEREREKKRKSTFIDSWLKSTWSSRINAEMHDFNERKNKTIHFSFFVY